MEEIFILHGIRKTLITNRDVKFTSNFWISLFKGMDTNLNFSTTYHPETDGQTERVNQVLEDMLRMYVMNQPGKWESYIHLVKFAYNNNHQASLKMSRFEVLYGRRCKVHLSLSNLEYRMVLGPKMLAQMETMVKQIKQNLKVAQDRQKSYAYRKRTDK